MGGVILLIVVVIVAGAIAANGKRRVEAQRRQGALMEMESVAKVINSSLGIINDTKNVDTLKSREQLVYEKLERIAEIERQGYQFSERNAGETKRLLQEAVNERLVELGRNAYDDILAKKDSYASVRSAVTAITKVQQKLIDYQRALTGEASNATASRGQLQKLHDALKHEVIVGQLKELVEKADLEDFKGNPKKARELYMEALHFLQTAGVDISRFTQERKYINDKLGSSGAQ